MTTDMWLRLWARSAAQVGQEAHDGSNHGRETAQSGGARGDGNDGERSAARPQPIRIRLTITVLR